MFFPRMKSCYLGSDFVRGDELDALLIEHVLQLVADQIAADWGADDG